MGNCVEDIAGRNLVRGAQSYDYFDEQNQIAGQIQGTRASTPAALLAQIRKGVNKLVNAPEVVDTQFDSGGRVRIVKSGLKVKFLMQAIPDTPPQENFSAVMRQIEQLEESSKVIIKLVPTPGME